MYTETILEMELGDTLHTLWPWYRNSFHAMKTCNDSSKYNELMKKDYFLQSWPMNNLLKILQEHEEKLADLQDEGNDSLMISILPMMMMTRMRMER